MSRGGLGKSVTLASYDCERLRTKKATIATAIAALMKYPTALTHGGLAYVPMIRLLEEMFVTMKSKNGEMIPFITPE